MFSGPTRIFLFKATAVLGALLFSGCASVETQGERDARERVRRAGEALGAGDGGALALPELRDDSPPDDFLRFALLKHPSARAAYYDWRAAVEAIVPARSLPDPVLSFEADISNMLMTAMPGVMFDFMMPGKRRAMGAEATAASEVARRKYVSAVLDVAANTRRAWVELAYAEELRRLRGEALAASEQALALAGNTYATASGMAGFEGQVRASNAVAQARAEIDLAEERRVAARARFKAALGLRTGDKSPPWPRFAPGASALPEEAELWRRALENNDGLATMRAMVEMAVAGVEVARTAGTPDFSLGVMADLKASPLMVRPSAGVTLPVWRKKIAATIAAAEARRDGAAARLDAEQLNLAAELAQMLFMARESGRMLAYIETAALPNAARSRAAAEAAYQSGMGEPAMIAGARIMEIEMRIERIAALRQRELAVTDLLRMVAAVAPADALPSDGRKISPEK
jgi:outer membrane protein TolC